jgi:hypothetical protein
MLGRAVLAALERSRTVTAAARGSQSTNFLSENWLIFVALAVIAVFGCGLYLWDRRRKTAGTQARTPQSLFQELCTAHKLNRSEQALLSNLCAAQELALPALVFVDSSILARAEAMSIDNPDGLRQLRQKLFPAAGAR